MAKSCGGGNPPCPHCGTKSIQLMVQCTEKKCGKIACKKCAGSPGAGKCPICKRPLRWYT
jgi:hypothetical protein